MKGGDEERRGERGTRVWGRSVKFHFTLPSAATMGPDTDLLTPTYVATRLPSRPNVIRHYAPSDTERRSAFDRQRRHSRENVKISRLAVPTHDRLCFRQTKHRPASRLRTETKRSRRITYRRYPTGVSTPPRIFTRHTGSSGLCPGEKFNFLRFSNGKRRCNGEPGETLRRKRRKRNGRSEGRRGIRESSV